LRKPVNEALLQLREDGTYWTLFEKWFGAASGGKDAK
jgi:ABC-type amino acid transport substrate-binding protein